MNKTVVTLILALSLGMLGQEAGAAVAATIQEATGIVYLSKQTGKRIIAAQGTTLEVGDTVYTEKDSEARLRFSDGGQIALRPNSALNIQNYRFSEPEPQQDSLVMSLLRGGLRNITGLIGKRGNREAYRMNAVVATIGVRGTDFIVRLCEADCEVDQNDAEQRKLKPKPVPIAARVALLEGQMVATSVGGIKRLVKIGSPILDGEMIETDAASHGALLFTDGGRLVMAKGSTLVVNSYRFVQARPEESGLFMQLVKGGVRFATGLVARIKPQQVRVSTITGTIGIRGTDFDLGCAPPDTAPVEIDPMTLVGATCDGAIAVRMRDGATAIGEGAAELVVKAGETGYVPSPGVAGRKVGDAEVMKDWDLPLPKDVTEDFGQLAGPDGRDQTQPGLYVLVKEGRVVIIQDGKETELDPGETGFIGLASDGVIRLGTPPLFLEADSSVREMNLDPMMCRAP